MTLSIFINGALRLRTPYRLERAAQTAAALAEELPKIPGRLGVVVEEGNVAWLITGQAAGSRSRP
jgi:predicted short-subunit dehydrogenase-like oxidoreductase (DUF2520 family)